MASSSSWSSRRGCTTTLASGVLFKFVVASDAIGAAQLDFNDANNNDNNNDCSVDGYLMFARLIGSLAETAAPIALSVCNTLSDSQVRTVCSRLI